MLHRLACAALVGAALPAPDRDGPFPLIVDLHGWSLGKTTTPYVDWANEGYVVLSYSAGGFHASCGTPASRRSSREAASPMR